MNRLSPRSVWESLFSKATGNTLGWFRLIFCLAIAAEVTIDRSFFIAKQASGFCGKLALFKFFNLPVVSATAYSTLLWVLIGALILSALGVGGRAALVLSAVLFTYLIGTVVGCDQGIEGIYTAWNHAIVCQNLFILAASPGVNAWSVPLYFKRASAGHSFPPRWPVELLKFNLVFAYFAGGIAKIRDGFSWMNGYTLQYHLLDRHLSLDIPLGYWFASSWWLCFVSSVIMVILELSCLIVFFVPRLAPFYVGAFFGLQVFWVFLMKLHWMKYFGWAYLIYAIEFAILGLTFWKNNKSRMGQQIIQASLD